MALRLDRKYNRRFDRGASRQPELAIGIPTFLFAHETGRKRLQWSFVAAIFIHLVLFTITLPAERRTLQAGETGPRVFVLEQVRFKPPEPKAVPTLPSRKARRVPIPDPTPDLPEPIEREDRLAETSAVDTDALAEDLTFIPAAPGRLIRDTAMPGPAAATPLTVGGQVLPPKKLYGPQPPYTEEARRARIQGVVVLQAVIDTEGRVTDIRILKGLALGLTESAVDTVRTWRFEPATLDGAPVRVYYSFNIRFTLQ